MGQWEGHLCFAPPPQPVLYLLHLRNSLLSPTSGVCMCVKGLRERTTARQPLRARERESVCDSTHTSFRPLGHAFIHLEEQVTNVFLKYVCACVFC